jgi:hypothetical protein
MDTFDRTIAKSQGNQRLRLRSQIRVQLMFMRRLQHVPTIGRFALGNLIACQSFAAISSIDSWFSTIGWDRKAARTSDPSSH